MFGQGDWSWGDWGTDVDMEVLTTCWYYLALKAEKEFALHLRKLYDANQIGEMMKRISAVLTPAIGMVRLIVPNCIMGRRMTVRRQWL